MDDKIPFSLTEAGTLALKITELEHILRHFDRATMDLHLYVRGIDGMPNAAEWELVRAQIEEMVDAYGPRNPYR
jgi:hypothetical protein